MNDDFYMRLALNEAWKNQILTYPNPAVGCVILDKYGQILSICAHEKAGFLHAEPKAILWALCSLSKKFFRSFLTSYNDKFGTNYIFEEFEKTEFEPNFTYEFIIRNHNNLLKDAKAYVTLEPCAHYGKTPPCALLFTKLGFKEVNIGSYDKTLNAKGGVEILKYNGIKVKSEILKTECDILLEPFIKWQKTGSFNFFKLAMSANGVINGGIISNLKSRTYSHKLRNIIDLLVIGGNTVRTDRPVLDTRLIKNGKNPDIFIYSNQSKFDKTIPLFSVENRNVFIGDDMGQSLSSGLVMIEGGQNLLNEIYKFVDWFLIFHSSDFKSSDALKSELEFKPLYRSNLDLDYYGWYKLK